MSEVRKKFVAKSDHISEEMFGVTLARCFLSDAETQIDIFTKGDGGNQSVATIEVLLGDKDRVSPPHTFDMRGTTLFVNALGVDEIVAYSGLWDYPEDEAKVYGIPSGTYGSIWFVKGNEVLDSAWFDTFRDVLTVCGVKPTSDTAVANGKAWARWEVDGTVEVSKAITRLTMPINIL